MRGEWTRASPLALFVELESIRGRIAGQSLAMIGDLFAFASRQLHLDYLL